MAGYSPLQAQRSEKKWFKGRINQYFSASLRIEKGFINCYEIDSCSCRCLLV